MKWPRGKYNGRRIVGIEFKLKLDLTTWRWLPLYLRDCGGLHWLCFRTWTQLNYDWRRGEGGGE